MIRTVSNRSTVLQSMEEKKINGTQNDISVQPKYCSIPQRSQPISIPIPISTHNLSLYQPQPRSQTTHNTDLLITSYHETVDKLRDIRNKLYKLGIDPEKLSI